MKDKVVFFILGAVLATFAYIAGNVSHVKAKDETTVDNLIVNDKLILRGDATIHGTLKVIKTVAVGDDLNNPYVIINANPETAGIMVTNSGNVDFPRDHYIHILAGDGPGGKNDPYAAIRIQQGEEKHLVLKPK